MTAGTELHLAAFDHRRSLDKALAALDVAPGRALDRLDAKQLIWRGVQRSLSVTDAAAILTDAEAGAVLDAAREAGVTTAMALEKSGQRWLVADRTPNELKCLLEAHRPTFAKLLVRWHPADPIDRQREQITAIRELESIAVGAGARLMLELLIPGDHDDAPLADAEPDIFHDEILPVRLADAIRQLSSADIVPAMWKLDGLPRTGACAHVAAAVREGSGGTSGIVMLGAGKDLDTVRGWFAAAAAHSAFCGFAVGRTIWWDAIEGYVVGTLSMDDAERTVGIRFAEVVAAYRSASGDQVEHR